MQSKGRDGRVKKRGKEGKKREEKKTSEEATFSLWVVLGAGKLEGGEGRKKGEAPYGIFLYRGGRN